MSRGTQGTPPTAARRASRKDYAERQEAMAEKARQANADKRPPAMTVEATGRYLGVSRWTIYRLINEGKLRHTKVGEHIRIRPVDIDAYLDENTEQAS